jgi:valyl-tRNA synthetase
MDSYRRSDQWTNPIRLEKRLGSSGFLSKASPEVVAETAATLEEKKAAIAVVKKSLTDLEVLA